MLTYCILLVLVSLSRALNQDVIDSKFEEFKSLYGRQYDSNEEEMSRKRVFSQNLHFIVQHNQKFEQGLFQFSVGVNRFADLTAQEFVKLKNGNISFNVESIEDDWKLENDDTLPDQIDWTERGVVSPVLNQGSLGFSNVFTAVASIESNHAIRTNHLVELSEQQVVDCFSNDLQSTDMIVIFRYIIKTGGLDTKASYPSKRLSPSMCHFNKRTIGAKIQGYIQVAKNSEKSLKKAVALSGPVAVYIDASRPSFQFYTSGVYDDVQCSSTDLDHTVLVVGYGKQSNQLFWKAKNSWGSQWGMKGFILIARNKKNLCGIASKASYPI